MALLLVLSCCSLFVGVIDLTPAELLAGNFEQMEVFLISRRRAYWPSCVLESA